MSDKPFLGLVVPFVPAVGWIRAYKAKEFPSDLVAIDVTAGGCYAGWRGPSKLATSRLGLRGCVMTFEKI